MNFTAPAVIPEQLQGELPVQLTLSAWSVQACHAEFGPEASVRVWITPGDREDALDGLFEVLGVSRDPLGTSSRSGRRSSRPPSSPGPA